MNGLYCICFRIFGVCWLLCLFGCDWVWLCYSCLCWVWSCFCCVWNLLLYRYWCVLIVDNLYIVWWVMGWYLLNVCFGNRLLLWLWMLVILCIVCWFSIGLLCWYWCCLWYGLGLLVGMYLMYEGSDNWWIFLLVWLYMMWLLWCVVWCLCLL